MRPNTFNELKAVFNWDGVNKDDIFKALKRDFQARTVKGSTSAALDATLPYIIDNVENIIKNPGRNNINDQQSFDKWHEQICQNFLKDFKKSFTASPVEFGKAQKMVNMCFKYWYCIIGNQYPTIFTYCHMPLDNYTFKMWFRDIVAPKYNFKRTESEYNWSNIDSKKYIAVQNAIRSYLGNVAKNTVYVDANNSPLSPFEAEFFIWPEMQLLNSIKVFNKVVGIANLKQYPAYTDSKLYHDFLTIQSEAALLANNFK